MSLVYHCLSQMSIHRQYVFFCVIACYQYWDNTDIYLSSRTILYYPCMYHISHKTGVNVTLGASFVYPVSIQYILHSFDIGSKEILSCSFFFSYFIHWPLSFYLYSYIRYISCFYFVLYRTHIYMYTLTRMRYSTHACMYFIFPYEWVSLKLFFLYCFTFYRSWYYIWFIHYTQNLLFLRLMVDITMLTIALCD